MKLSLEINERIEAFRYAGEVLAISTIAFGVIIIFSIWQSTYWIKKFGTKLVYGKTIY